MHQVAKVWSFSFTISPFNEYSELISFGFDWLDLLGVPGDSEDSSPEPQFERINSSVLSLLYGPTLTSMAHMTLENMSHMTTGKTITLTIQIIVGKVISLLFNILSRFVIAFLLRIKCLLISWLQSLSAVILELKKIKFVTASAFPLLFAMK